MKNKYIHRSKISEAKFRQLKNVSVSIWMHVKPHPWLISTGIQSTDISIWSVNRLHISVNWNLLSREKSKSMNHISVERGSKGKEGVEPFAKHPFSVCSKETVKSIQKLSQIALKPHCKPLFVGKPTWRVWSTPTVGEATMGWSILDTKNISESIHSNDEFARGKSHINGIESYWSFAKSRLLQFHGVPNQTFYLHLKETEFRFNYRNEDSYSMLLDTIRKQPLI